MKTLTKILIVSLLVSLPNFSKAQSPDTQIQSRFSDAERKAATEDPKSYLIDPASIRIIKIKEEKLERHSIQTTLDDFMTKEDELVFIDKIINTAAKIWGLIKNNAPVMNITTKYATAVPKGLISWINLSNWKTPRAYTYAFNANNFYGTEVIHVQYKVIYMYGGNYKGKGQYLTGVTIVPEIVNVAWAYRFKLNAEVPDSTVINVGSSDNPIAAMQLKISWTIESMIKASQGTSIYYIQGDGQMQQIASPFKAEVEPIKIEDVQSAKVLMTDDINKIF